MRGTRVDKLDNGRYRILHFGRFFDSTPSNEFYMSEKDALNLTYQLVRKFPEVGENYYEDVTEEVKDVAMDKGRDSDNDNPSDDTDRGVVPNNVDLATLKGELMT